MAEVDRELAGLFSEAFESPEAYDLAVIQISLLMLENELLEELARLHLPATVLDRGFDDPAYREWLTEPKRNRATHDHSFNVIMFAQQLKEAQRAIEDGDFRNALYVLSAFVAPPFRVQDKPGGKKAKIPPRLAALMQRSAEQYWRKNPNLSVKRVAELIRPGWAEIYESRRWGDPPAVRTIRGKLTKPDCTKKD